MRSAAGIVVDRGAVWLAVEADGRLSAVYGDPIGGEDEDGFVDRFSSLHEVLGAPDAVGRLVATIRAGTDPDDEVEIHVVEADGFDVARAAVAMTRIAPERLAGVMAAGRVTDAAATIALQAVALQRLRGSATVRPRTIWIGEDVGVDGPVGTFSVSWDGPEGHGDGPQQVTLEGALSWAQAQRSDVVLRVGHTLYGVPSRPVDGDGEPLPEWRGSASSSGDAG